MQKIIISDTSCLILLHKLEEFPILEKLFGEVIITSIVSNEFRENIPRFIKIIDPQNQTYQALLQAVIDKGEASSIALAVEQENPLLIVDDLKARKVAAELGLMVTGTMGILIDAKLKGYIPSISTILTKIKQTNFRISSELELKIRKACNE